MKKLDYLFVSIIIFSIVISSISIGMVIDQNSKFDNINNNFQGMRDSTFRTIQGMGMYNCYQDFEIRDNTDMIVTDNMNTRTDCLMKLEVANKVFQYQIYQVEPEFNDTELKYLETLQFNLDSSIFQSVDDTPQELISNTEIVISNVTINSP